MTKLSPEVAKNVDHWSSDLFDESTRAEIKNLEKSFIYYQNGLLRPQQNYFLHHP